MGKEKLTEIWVVGSSKHPGEVLKQSGVVDFEKLLLELKNWFFENNYLFIEKEHTEKDFPDGKDIEVKWTSFRNIDDYVRFWIDVEVWILRCIDVSVKRNGETVKRQKGDIEIRFSGYFQKNYHNTFSPSVLGEMLRQMYERFIIKKRLVELEGKIWLDTQTLIDRARLILERAIRW